MRTKRTRLDAEADVDRDVRSLIVLLVHVPIHTSKKTGTCFFIHFKILPLGSHIYLFIHEIVKIDSLGLFLTF